MRHPWTGFGCKTLWDWMSLLIVPLVIVAAAAVFSFLNVQIQQQTEDDRLQQSVLQSYIQDMTGLLLDRGLATSESDQTIRDIARASTLSAVRQLDSDRKGILLQFLYESDLIKDTDGSSNPTLPIIYLSRADLRGANLERAKNLTNQELAQAWSLVGATMPDGRVMTAEGWEEFHERYRQ